MTRAPISKNNSGGLSQQHWAWKGGNGLRFSGLVNADRPSYSVVYTGAANGAKNAGSYSIVSLIELLGATASNYSLTVANGTLTTNKAPLVVTANDVLRAYGRGNPNLTAQISGLVSGDGPNIVTGVTGPASTAATAASPVGSYAIVPSGAALYPSSTTSSSLWSTAR